VGHYKGSLRGKFIAMSAYIRRTERSQINNLMLHLKLLKKEQAIFKTSRMREIIKIMTKINEMETKKKKTVQRINEAKRWVFEKINKIEKPVAHPIKKRREKTQIIKIRKEKRGDNNEHQGNPGIIRDYFENLYSNKLKKCTLFHIKRLRKQGIHGIYLIIRKAKMG
jgi:hypothetical protein